MTTNENGIRQEENPQEAKQEEIRAGIYLADGTYIQGSAGYANGDLWIWTDADAEETLIGMATTFADEAKTAKITFVATATVIQEWDGFTRLTTVKINEDGIISVRMRRAANV